MLPDPFTATVASVGLLATIFTTVTTTAQRVFHLESKWHEYWPTVLSLKTRVQNCRDQMDKIALTWRAPGDACSPLHLQYLLGCDAPKRIEEMVYVVESFERQIHMLIQRHVQDACETGSPVFNDTGAFERWLALSESRASETMKGRVASKVAYSLATGEILDAKVKRLEDGIAALKEFLSMRLDNMADVVPHVQRGTQTAIFITALLKLRHRSESVAQQLTRLGDCAFRSSILCGIVPRLKDAEGHFTRLLDDRGLLTVSFSLDEYDSPPALGHSILVPLSGKSPVQEDCFSQLRELSHQPPNLSRPKYVQLPHLTLSFHDTEDPQDVLAKLQANEARCKYHILSIFHRAKVVDSKTLANGQSACGRL